MPKSPMPRNRGAALPITALGRWLGSTRGAVVVLATWAGLSVLGTLVPQGLAGSQYLDRYGTAAGGAILAIGLDHAFSSPLYLGIAAAVGLAIVACFARRAASLRARLGTVATAGSLALHVGVIIILAGFLVTAVAAREEYLWLQPGQSGSALGVAVSLADFEIQYNSDLSPQQYVSRGTVSTAGGGGGREFELSVNHPLRWDGAAIYQAAYRWAIDLTVLGGDQAEHDLLLPQGASIPWPGTALQLMLADFAETAGHNPAAAVLVHDGTQPIGVWQMGAGERQQYAGLWLEFTGWHPQTGLLVRRDGGVPIVAFGALWILAGIVARLLGARRNPQPDSGGNGGKAGWI